MIYPEFQLHQFKNGIRIIHQQVNSPVAHLGVIINAGSRDEEAPEQGMAHFIEHSIFKGTKKRRAFHILSRIEDVGGEINAYTTKEETALFVTFLSDYFERSAELLSDILFNSVFPEKELDKEKEVVLDEINSFNDSPSELIFDEFEELVFDGHPIARNILGTPEIIKSFNKKNIVKFINRNYNTDQIVISSVGNYDFNKIITLLEKYFGWAKTNTRNTKRKPVEIYPAQVQQKQKDTFQAHCILGNAAFDSNHPKRIVMVLLNSLLGGNSMNSRLNMALRERNGLAYNIESNYTAYSDTGLFSVYFGTDRENCDKALNLVFQEFKKLRDKNLGTLQLSKAKKQLLGQIAISTENKEEMMLSIGKSYLLYNKVDPLQVVFDKINAITTSEVADVANEILNEKFMSRLIYN